MPPGGPLNFLENTELGVSVLETIASRKALEVVLLTLFPGALAAEIIVGKAGGVDKVPDALSRLVLDVVGSAESTIGAPLFQSFMQAALGINLSDISGQEAGAVKMIERAIGFAAGLPLVVGPVAGFLEAQHGHHAPRELGRAIRSIPHEMGMSFFLGTTLASIFETATRGPIGEAIKEQTRPERLEWPQIARLLKAKQMDETTAIDKLKKAGFRDQDIPHVLKLDNQLLSLSQVSKLHDIGWFDDSAAQEYLDRLGYEPTDRDSVLRIFSHDAASEGATSFRTTARNAYRDQYLSETAYRGMLAEVQTPPESIDLLVAGVQLERDAGRLHLTIANIKDLFDHNHIDGSEVRQRLAILGMTDADIGDLLVVWSDGKKVARSGIGTAKILGYLLGKVITKAKAYEMLIANGMRQADAQFLVDNPTTHPQTVTKPVTPAAIIAAYKDDVITVDEARKLLEELKINPTQLELLIASATARVVKGKKPKQPTRTLSEANVLDALKFRLASPTWAERELETLGWAADDASLIVMIELAKLDPANLATYGWQQLT